MVGYPFGISHLNVKTLFSVSFGLAEEIGLDMAYGRIGLTMEGTHPPVVWTMPGILRDCWVCC